jgi:hypothetical protein
VDRRAYLLSGLGLGVLKYVVDATLVRAFTGQGWTLIDYLSPSLLLPAGKALVQPVPLVWLMLGWTIPFLWIGASMSIRRALDADLSPGLAFLFFVPFVNWLLMLGLAAAPSRPASAPRSPALAESPLEARIVVLCTLLDVALTYAVLGIGVYLLRDYGVALFVGLPFLLGAMNGYVCNRIAPRSVSATVMATGISLVLLSATLLLFAAEGIFCVLMAFPLIAPVVMAASILGRFLALRCRTRPRRTTSYRAARRRSARWRARSRSRRRPRPCGAT